jgi:putative redox protein
MALLNRSGSDTSAMRAVARQRENLTHDVKVGDHVITVDEPEEQGGDDLGPSPQELLAAALASCTAVTMEMYAKRKGWQLGGVEVEVDVEYEDFTPVSFAATIELPDELSEEQRERLLAVARKCPVHKVLAGETHIEVSERLGTS